MKSHTSTNFYPLINKQPINLLLTKDDVGQPKPSTFNLPPNQFTYGRPCYKDDEGAKEVSMTWKFHEETRDKDPERDFAKLNKMSVTQGCFKSDQQSVFRKVVDARKSIPKGKNALPIYIPEEDFRYGIPNRPSTPIKLVIGNSYGYEGAIMKEDFYKQRAESLANTRHTLPRRNNKANALSYNYTRQKIQEIDSQGNKEYFKLSKFKAVKPRTNTFVKGHPNSKTLGGATSNREARKTQPMQQNQNQPNHQYVHDEDVPNEA